MQQALGRVNDHSVNRDLIATQKAAHILRASAASEEPGVTVLLRETLPFFPPCLPPSSPLILLPAHLPFLDKFIYLHPPLTPTLPSLSACALISLGSQQQRCASNHTHTHALSIPLLRAHGYSMRITWECRRLDLMIQIFVYSALPISQHVGTEISETKLIICASSHRASKTHSSSQICTEDWSSPLTWSNISLCQQLMSVSIHGVSFLLNHKSILHTGSMYVCLFFCFPHSHKLKKGF